MMLYQAKHFKLCSIESLFLLACCRQTGHGSLPLVVTGHLTRVTYDLYVRVSLLPCSRYVCLVFPVTSLAHHRT